MPFQPTTLTDENMADCLETFYALDRIEKVEFLSGKPIAKYVKSLPDGTYDVCFTSVDSFARKRQLRQAGYKHVATIHHN